MPAYFTLREFLNGISRDVAVADTEMQLLQQQAWQELIKNHITQHDALTEPYLAQLETELLEGLEEDRFLALNEVDIQFNLKQRSAWARFWYRVRHPKAPSNPPFKLCGQKPGKPTVQIRVKFKRRVEGGWKMTSESPEPTATSVEFIV